MSTYTHSYFAVRLHPVEDSCLQLSVITFTCSKDIYGGGLQKNSHSDPPLCKHRQDDMTQLDHYGERLQAAYLARF